MAENKNKVERKLSLGSGGWAKLKTAMKTNEEFHKKVEEVRKIDHTKQVASLFLKEVVSRSQILHPRSRLCVSFATLFFQT